MTLCAERGTEPSLADVPVTGGGGQPTKQIRSVAC